MDGIEATRRIVERRDRPAPRVLVLTTFDLDEYVFGALRAGASGFLLKDAPPSELVDGDPGGRTRRGAARRPSITRRLIERLRRAQPTRRSRRRRLRGADRRASARCCALVARGLSNAEIAARARRHRGDGQDPRRRASCQARPARPRPGRRARLRARHRHGRRRRAGVLSQRQPTVSCRASAQRSRSSARPEGASCGSATRSSGICGQRAGPPRRPRRDPSWRRRARSSRAGGALDGTPVRSASRWAIQSRAERPPSSQSALDAAIASTRRRPGAGRRRRPPARARARVVPRRRPSTAARAPRSRSGRRGPASGHADDPARRPRAERVELPGRGSAPTRRTSRPPRRRSGRSPRARSSSRRRAARRSRPARRAAVAGGALAGLPRGTRPCRASPWPRPAPSSPGRTATPAGRRRRRATATPRSTAPVASESKIGGSSARGTPKRPSSSASQSSRRARHSKERRALPASHAWIPASRCRSQRATSP